MTDPSGRSRDRSRRAVLSACGAGMAALAGCGDLDVAGIGGDDAPEYDADRLRGIAGRELPTRPDTFPVTVPDPMLARHRERARELLSAVPERPDLPNGVVVRELRERRERTRDDLGKPLDGETAIRRLSEARSDRGRAAEVNGAYRAAIREIDRETIARRRGALRDGLAGFEAAFAYRGPDPAGALVVGAELERFTGSIRRDAEAWPPVPADPATDPFGVGEVARNVESGEAALADARRLRERYLDGDDPPSHGDAITAASGRIGLLASRETRRIEEYVEAEPGELPFDREIEGTPAEYLYRRPGFYLEEDGGEERRDGDHATATLRNARRLAAGRAFRAAVDAIRAGEYGEPEDAERVATAHEAAVAALEAAWETEPAAMSPEVAWPAREALETGRHDLERTDGHAREANRALGRFGFARLYAEAVPGAVGAVVDALDGAG